MASTTVAMISPETADAIYFRWREETTPMHVLIKRARQSKQTVYRTNADNECIGCFSFGFYTSNEVITYLGPNKTNEIALSEYEFCRLIDAKKQLEEVKIKIAIAKAMLGILNYLKESSEPTKPPSKLITFIDGFLSGFTITRWSDIVAQNRSIYRFLTEAKTATSEERNERKAQAFIGTAGAILGTATLFYLIKYLLFDRSSTVDSTEI